MPCHKYKAVSVTIKQLNRTFLLGNLSLVITSILADGIQLGIDLIPELVTRILYFVTMLHYVRIFIHKHHLNEQEMANHECNPSAKLNIDDTSSAMNHLLCEVIDVKFIGVGYFWIICLFQWVDAHQYLQIKYAKY